MLIILSLIIFVAFTVKSTCRRGSKSNLDQMGAVERSSRPSSLLSMSTPNDHPNATTRKDVEGATTASTSEYKVYPMRWFILMTVNLLALSNATMWMTYTSSTEATAKFYCNTTSEGAGCEISKWTSQIFQLMGTILGIMGMYVTDKHGIKVSARAGCLLNMMGALIRIVSSIPTIPFESRTGILHCGTIIVSSAQPFFLVLSPKVAEYWFPEDQRAFANVLSFIANPLGVALGTIIPIFIMDSGVGLDSSHFLTLNIILATVPVVAFIMSMLIRKGVPPTAPSASSDNHSAAPDFCMALGMLFKNKHFYVILIVFGGAFGQLWSVYTASDILLNILGYSPSITGFMIVIACAFGVAISLVFGVYVDKTKKFKEVIRVCMIGFFFTSIAFNVLTRFKPSECGKYEAGFVPLLVVINALLGMFSIPVFPIGIELGIEATFPIQEATSSGLLVIMGQLELFIVILAMDGARSFTGLDMAPAIKINPSLNTTRIEPSMNHTLANDIWCGVSLVSALIAIFLLNPPYKRVAFEKEHKEKVDSARTTPHPSETAVEVETVHPLRSSSRDRSPSDKDSTSP
ncbi:hypothetical protein PFISCL1PPCAC_2368 [Pristionchus fissidentatus]|uniref:Membrane transporter n=1 Tax=Pristionchus fissidentatus TaxID=1538716 RepID=A0AAV5UUV1_9BILA|nr:hypothetical protein PFISCL1PPCAC_2368 [Pristionchus fissidentatus]